jgi:hypothetical protein
MKHVVIKNTLLNGWEYGMLRSFETAIVKETGAGVFEIPHYEFAPGYMTHFEQGMKRGIYRKYFPKQEFQLRADVAWCILMGPENYRLDLYKNWADTCKTKILYIYDTMPSQYPVIKRLFSNNTWDILITSFNDAVDDLEKMTGRKWHCVEQAADKDLFQPVPLNERLIHFSSYGRRYPVLHEALQDFCSSNGLYYDYTTHDARHPVVDATELYRQYAWHLSHSLFTLSWPVEFTHPARAGHLHPVTCRWFEAAAAGTTILGMQPGNIIFNKWLAEDMVINIDPNSDKKHLYKKLGDVWSDRENLFNKASLLRTGKFNNWTWNERVNRIISWL